MRKSWNILKTPKEFALDNTASTIRLTTSDYKRDTCEPFISKSSAYSYEFGIARTTPHNFEFKQGLYPAVPVDGGFNKSFPHLPCKRDSTSITVSYPLTIEKSFIKLLPLSYYSQDHFWMEGSSDSLAVSSRFQKCTFTTSSIIRRENRTFQASVL